MRIAQQLYEGVNIKGQGTVGLITYLRTDSTRISVEADAAAKEYIEEAYGARASSEQELSPRKTTRKYRMPMKPSAQPT